MGKCLSRIRKLGKNANASNEPAGLKDIAELSDLAQPVAATNEQMGISSSSSRGQPAAVPAKTAYPVSGKMYGAGEQSDRMHGEKSTRRQPGTVPPVKPAMTLATSSECFCDDSVDLENKRAAELFFACYRDEDTDCILADGIERLCADVGVAPDDFSVLVLAWKFNAETMCRFSKTEFIDGCHAIGDADSPESIRARLPVLVAEAVDSRELFRDLYRWTYRFGLDIGQRTLPLAMAISLWQLVFSQRPPAVLDRWLAFLERRPSGSSGIMRDTWDMFLLFTEVIGTDFERYDESEAWPSLIDDFVEFENDKKNHNVATNIQAGDFCP